MLSFWNYYADFSLKVRESEKEKKELEDQLATTEKALDPYRQKAKLYDKLEEATEKQVGEINE